MKKYGYWYNPDLINIELNIGIESFLNEYLKKWNIDKKNIDIENFCRHINGNVGNDQEKSLKEYIKRNKSPIICTYKESIFKKEYQELIKDKIIFFFCIGTPSHLVFDNIDKIQPFWINVVENYEDLAFGGKNVLNILKNKNIENKFKLIYDTQIIDWIYSSDMTYIFDPESIVSLFLAEDFLIRCIQNNLDIKKIIWSYDDDYSYLVFGGSKDSCAFGKETLIKIEKKIKELKFLRELL